MAICKNADSFGSGPDRFLPPGPESQPIEDDFIPLTEDQHLGNVEAYTDWLHDECGFETAVDTTGILYQVLMPNETFDVGLYQLKIDAATVSQLLHITLTASCASRAWPAQCELKRRYLAAQGL